MGKGRKQITFYFEFDAVLVGNAVGTNEVKYRLPHVVDGQSRLIVSLLSTEKLQK